MRFAARRGRREIDEKEGGSLPGQEPRRDQKVMSA